MNDTTHSNTPEYTVSELSGALKRTVEDAYDHVRVRGELGRVTIAKSGHLYLDLKDEKSALDGVMWKGMASLLNFRPEEGLEVIAEGRLSTFPGRSKYQMIIDRLEPAGEGALMALLEARKKQLAKEGLFDPDRKRALPYLPRVIGVVTSPTGAVIRDILHRLSDRFPLQVLLWPVLVQGDKAAGQISAAIEGFNSLTQHGPVPRPDVLIVARGGGSVEDLWCFNEEIVVRAAADSNIPLISAVGHETDTTLIDYASDRRAPTPTGAAEMVVPVRRELMERIQQAGLRLKTALQRGLDTKGANLKSASRALPKPDMLIGEARQRLDYASAQLASAAQIGYQARSQHLAVLSGRLQASSLSKDVKNRERRLETWASRLDPAILRNVSQANQIINQLDIRLQSVSHESVLKRGFALIKTPDGHVVQNAIDLQESQNIRVQMNDGTREAIITEARSVNEAKKIQHRPAIKRKAKAKLSPGQGSLF